MTEYRYRVGQAVECRDINGGKWRPAYVSSLAPQRGRAGYYIIWTDIDWEGWRAECAVSDPPMPSCGGWTYEACMRDRERAISEIQL